MRIVRLYVEKKDESLKLIWTDLETGRREIYLVNYQDVKDEAEEVKTKLSDLVEEWKASNSLSTKERMKDLAKAGNSLYNELFYSHEQDNAESAKEWIMRQNDIRIEVCLESFVHIPWGLIFDGDLDAFDERDTLNTDLIQNFWSVKYNISAFYVKTKPSNAKLDIDYEKICLLPVFQEEVFKEIDKLDTDEMDLLSKIMSDFSDGQHPLASSNDFYKDWEKAISDSKNTLLYFCCHALQNNLDLSSKDQDGKRKTDIIRANKLGQQAQKLLSMNKYDKICFAFLNGCFTSVGYEESGGFIKATSHRGFFGFIGTESEIPDIFAIRFGLKFIYSFLYEEKRIYEIMEELRNEFWPISLIYGVYCIPTLRILRS